MEVRCRHLQRSYHFAPQQPEQCSSPAAYRDRRHPPSTASSTGELTCYPAKHRAHDCRLSRPSSAPAPRNSAAAPPADMPRRTSTIGCLFSEPSYISIGDPYTHGRMSGVAGSVTTREEAKINFFPSRACWGVRRFASPAASAGTAPAACARVLSLSLCRCLLPGISSLLALRLAARLAARGLGGRRLPLNCPDKIAAAGA